MLNDIYSQSTSRLSEIETILSNIGYLSEEDKEKEDDDKKKTEGEDGKKKEDDDKKKKPKRWQDSDGDGKWYEPGQDVKVKKEDLDFSSVLDDFSDEDIVFLTDDLIEEMVEEALTECLNEGYAIEDLEMMLVESLDEAAKQLDLFQHQKQQQRKEKIAKIKGAVKSFASKVKSKAAGAAKAAASGAKKVAVKAAGAAGEVAGAARAGYAAGKAKHSAPASSSGSSSGSSSSSSSETEKPKRPSFLSRVGAKLKSGIKKVVGKAARKVSSGAGKVASRLGEEKVSEGLDEACWKGYEAIGMKMKGGKKVPNCVPKEEYADLAAEMIGEGYAEENVRAVIAALEDGWSVIFESDGYYFEMEDLTEAKKKSKKW